MCLQVKFPSSSINNSKQGKGKSIPLQTLTGPEVSRRLRLSDVNKIGT
jgi:hypothetical protein